MGTVVQSVLILILMILVILLMSEIGRLQGTARVINYAGLVRGATQREVKLEITGYQNDELIQYLDDILNGLKYGDGNYNLITLDDTDYNKKLDAQSGTALALADSIKEVLGSDYFYKFDRSGERAQRNPKEIGISAVRGGTIVGEHEVIFAGEDEVIEFKHTAYSKSVFAKGSIEAAKFLAGKPAGYYDMRDVIAAKQ